MKKLGIVAAATVMTLNLTGCAALMGAGVGAAAATAYNDENEVCNPPTDAGVLDDDC